MYYFETYDFIIKILTNLYLDSNNINISKKDDIFSSIINRNDFKKFSSMLSGIIGTKIPLNLNSIKKSNKYMTKITLEEYINSLSNPIINKEFINKENVKDINSNIISLFTKDSKNIEIKSSNIFYRNSRDAILYLSDLDMLNSDISISKKSGLFTINELSNLYSMTVRLILPKYIADKINCKNKLMYLYKDEKYRIHFSNQKNINKSEINEIHNMIMNYTKDGIEHTDLLTNDTLYIVYINATFKEFSNIINKLFIEETAYDEKVIAAIYYYLFNFNHIRSLFTIDPKIAYLQ